MGRGGRPARGERGGCRGVRAVRRVTVLGGQGREGGRIRAERGDLERRCGRGFELLLQREVALRILRCARLRIAECRESVLPDAAVGVRKLDGALADRVRLGGRLRLPRPTAPSSARPSRRAVRRTRP